MPATTKKPSTVKKAVPTKAPQKAVKKTAKPKAHPTKPPATRKAAKVSQRPPTKKAATSKPATAKKRATPPPPTDMVFRPGSDSQVIWEEILKGGTSRKDVLMRLAAHYSGVTTRGGKPKPISTVMNYLIRRAVQTGKFEVVSSWSVRPIAGTEEVAPKPAKVAGAVASTRRTLAGEKPKKAAPAPAKKAPKIPAKPASKPSAKGKKSSAATTPRKVFTAKVG